MLNTFRGVIKKFFKFNKKKNYKLSINFVILFTIRIGLILVLECMHAFADVRHVFVHIFKSMYIKYVCMYSLYVSFILSVLHSLVC